MSSIRVAFITSEGTRVEATAAPGDVLLDVAQGAGMPLAPSLPEPLKRLASHDAHDLSDERWSYDVGRLIEATDKLAGKSGRSRRRLLAALGAALLVIATATGAFFSLRTRQPPIALAGDWTAEVTYDWGAKFAEGFSFTVHGGGVIGSASLARSSMGGG